MKNALDIIGMHERITISKHDIKDLPTKTDTGAYNCAIDCSFAEERINETGDKVLVYTLLNPESKYYSRKRIITKKYKVKTVRSSNGIETLRYQVKLNIELKGKKYKTTFNLSNRAKMRYPVLLGRKFIANRFLVDVGKGRKLKSK